MSLWILVGACVGAGIGWSAGYLLGHRKGSSLCPNDEVLRDVARQRDQAIRERDEARWHMARSPYIWTGSWTRQVYPGAKEN